MKTKFVCANCGAVAPRWSGKCQACGEWNTIAEEAEESAVILGSKRRRSKTAKRSLEITTPNEALLTDEAVRYESGLTEFDSTLSGGLVPGSVLLIGGEPGIGKSTLLLQVLAGLEVESLYISGEESLTQVARRAQRLGLDMNKPALAAETETATIIDGLAKNPKPVVVIDSIQTMYLAEIDSAPGSVLQLRASTAEFARIARKHNICVIIIGHVTKDGQIAGPKVLEHIVDTVLYFEGDGKGHHRIIRAVKNRYGASGELGIFEMGERGLQQVAEPSAVFLPERRGEVEGSVTFCAIEGQRPLLLEIQALAAPSSGVMTPRRAVVGWNPQRLAMILAVLDIRCGVNLSAMEVYLNVTGGLRLEEPAVDLAAAAAILSSVGKLPSCTETVVFGEVGLSGELRSVPHGERRLAEAAKRGFKRAFIPLGGETQMARCRNQGLAITAFKHIKELIGVVGDRDIDDSGIGKNVDKNKESVSG